MRKSEFGLLYSDYAKLQVVVDGLVTAAIQSASSVDERTALQQIVAQFPGSHLDIVVVAEALRSAAAARGIHVDTDEPDLLRA